MTDNVWPMYLSPHFTTAELCFSQTAVDKDLDNTPPIYMIENGVWLAKNLEKIRTELLNTPVKVNSGFRSLELHRAIYWRNPNAAPLTSAHLKFLAADIIPMDLDLDQAFKAIQHSDIPYDQLIMETNGKGSRWIHLGLKPVDGTPRRDVLRGTGDAGVTKYDREKG